MRKLMMRSFKLLQVMLCLLFILPGCENKENVQPDLLSAEQVNEMKSRTKIYYGPATVIGDGTARVWVEMMKGKPVALGVEVSEEAMNSISGTGMVEVALKLPGQAHATGFKTIMIGWNPMGHEPAGVYTIPHFDFHFYLQTQGQIMNIEGGIDAGAYIIEKKGIFPSFYTYGPVPFAVPHMGLHWSDIRSPEFGPEGFSRTFIYGSHQDRVTFLEPMITLAFLQSMELGEMDVLQVPSLNVYENPGYYPNTYTISHNSNGTYSIALTDLIWHNRNREK